MKIKFLELKNFIGIYNGTGKYSITLDFENKSKNRIILLEGDNGSGKTTILSCLHPFATTLDDRKTFILNGKEGKKLIIINKNDYDYKITHIYGKGKTKKTTSYISKRNINSNNEDDWEELNETGLVTSFKEIVERELDVTEDFFKISRIGSNVSNFIDMKTAERKQYMSLFLSDVDIYLHYYKKISDKFTRNKALIKSVTNDINRLGNEEEINIAIEVSSKLIKEIENEINNLNNKIQNLKGSINVLDPDGNLVKEFDKINDKMSNLVIKNEELDHDCMILLDKVPNLKSIKRKEEKLESTKQKKVLAEQSLNNIKGDLDKLRKTKNESSSQLSDKQELLKKYKSKKSLEELEELLEKMKNEKEYIDEEYNKDIYEPYKSRNLNKEVIEDFTDLVNMIDSEVSTLKSCYELDVISYISDTLQEKDLADILNEVDSEIHILNMQNKKFDEKNRQYEINYKYMEKNLSLARQLDNRPKNCRNDTCPFIAEALKFKDVGEKLQELSESINKITKQKKINEKKLDELDDKRKVVSALLTLMDKISGHQKTFLRVPLGKINLMNVNDIIFFNLNKINNYINRCTDYVEIIEDKERLEKSINELIERIEVLKDKEEIIKNLNKDIEQLNNKIDELEIEIKDKESKYKEYVQSIKLYSATISVLEEYIEKSSLIDENNIKIKELKKEYDKLEESYEKVAKYLEDIEDFQIRKKNKEEALKPEKNKLEKAKSKQIKLKDYTEKKAKLESNYNYLKLIRESLSSTKGIPLLFIKLYLKETKDICNKLLDKAYRGDLRVIEFKIEENEFLIRIERSNGEILDDISIASQGEQSLVSVAISLALIEQSMRKYNILLLDEIDATLDQSNRRSFLEILDTQLDSLNVEQTFIITHNREFDDTNVDIIEMPSCNIVTKKMNK